MNIKKWQKTIVGAIESAGFTVASIDKSGKHWKVHFVCASGATQFVTVASTPSANPKIIVKKTVRLVKLAFDSN